MQPSEPLKRILLVDDEDDLREVAVMSLQLDKDFEILACCSGHDAVAAAPAFRPQLLLLDVMMPGMDGPTTLRALRQLPDLPSIAAVFMTASFQPQDVAYYRSLGAVQVIGKPFEPMELAATIRAIWRRQQQ